MAKHNASPVAICPFYKDEDRQKVYCEGIEGSSSTLVTFAVPDARKEFCTTHCRSWGWEECPVAKMLWAQYEDEDEVSTVAASVEENQKLKRGEPRKMCPGRKFSSYPPEELRLISQRGGVASGKSRRRKRERIELEKVQNAALVESRRDCIAMLRADAAMLLEVQALAQNLKLYHGSSTVLPW